LPGRHICIFAVFCRHQRKRYPFLTPHPCKPTIYIGEIHPFLGG
jgi:hypothetical protein